MTSCPSVLLSMPMMSGEICTVPSGSVVCAGHWTLRPTGDSAVLMMFNTVCGLNVEDEVSCERST